MQHYDYNHTAQSCQLLIKKRCAFLQNIEKNNLKPEDAKPRIR